MSLVDQLLGRRVANESAPLIAAKQQKPLPRRIQPPQDEEEDKLRKRAARQRSVVASIMGVSESDDEGIIPDDAQEVDTLTGGEHIPGIRNDPLPKPESPAEPERSASNSGGEELIEPTAALVAPDITPNVMRPIDPSQVPAPAHRPAPPPSVAAAQQMGAQDARGALGTILGRQNIQPQPDEAATAAMAESMVAQMTHPLVAQQKVAEAMTPAQEGGAMPVHQEGDGHTVYNAFRRFM